MMSSKRMHGPIMRPILTNSPRVVKHRQDSNNSNLTKVTSEQFKNDKRVINKTPRHKTITPPDKTESQAKSEIVGDIKIPLRRSLFAYVPPYILFQPLYSNEPRLPVEITNHLRFKLNHDTPQIVRQTLSNAGYNFVKEFNGWCGAWRKNVHRTKLKEYQKINHFLGTSHWSAQKDHLWMTMNSKLSKYGEHKFGFFPRTYVMPQDLKKLNHDWERSGGKWIVKPPRCERSNEMREVHSWWQIPKYQPMIVQHFVTRPKLMNCEQFVIQLWLLVTSMNPLRIYLYTEGLIYFTIEKYINKDRVWTLKKLWSNLEKEGVDVQKLWSTIKDIAIKTMISGESSAHPISPSKYNCYEVFGLELLLDDSMKVWLIDLTALPSMAADCPEEIAVKGPLVRNILNIAGYQIPPVLPKSETEVLQRKYHLHDLCQDYSLYLKILKSKKHDSFIVRNKREEYKDAILKCLTQDDVRTLILYEDELTQLGRFEKIFPTHETHVYLRFFDVLKYYDKLLDSWEYFCNENNREEGIAKLQYMCKRQFHLSQTRESTEQEEHNGVFHSRK